MDDGSSGATSALPARRSSALARFACLAYLVLVVYASLTPWSGWRDIGIGAFAYLTAPWPERVTRFDVIVNVLGYVPFGLLVVLALYPSPRGVAAVALALVAAVPSKRCRPSCRAGFRPRSTWSRTWRGRCWAPRSARGGPAP